MTTSRSSRRRRTGVRAHVADHRQRQDAVLVQRRAREDALIEEYDRALEIVSRAEVDRDAALLDLRLRMRSIREDAAAKIAEAKKKLVEVVTELKKDHTAEEAAPLLDLTVEQFNKLLYSGRTRSEPTQNGTAEPGPATASAPPTPSAEPRSPSPSSSDRPSAQIALVLEPEQPTSPSPATTLTASQCPGSSATEDGASESPPTEATERC